MNIRDHCAARGCMDGRMMKRLLHVQGKLLVYRTEVTFSSRINQKENVVSCLWREVIHQDGHAKL